MNIHSFGKATAAIIVLTALAFLGFFAAGHVASSTLMTPWSSVAYLAVGCSLWIHSSSENRAVLHAGALLAIAIGAVVCGEYMSGAGSTEFDRLIFPDHLPVNALLPGRPAPIAGLRFCLLGVVLFLARSRSRPAVLFREWSAIAVIVMCYFGFVSVVIEWGKASPRSISPVAGILGILAAANVLATGKNGHLLPLLQDHGPGGMIARSLMPAAMIIPVLNTILGLVFSRFGIYDSNGKVALLSINILAAISILWIGASKVRGLDLLRRNAEDALRSSEARMRLAQQVSQIGTFEWNIETDVNVWTPELEVMHGLPPGSFLGTQSHWEDLVHPDDRARVVQQVKESFETGSPAEGAWRVVWPDSSIHWLAGRWQVFKNAAGGPLRMMGVNIDVTNRKQMEDALRQSEERFRLAIKATNDAIWDVDLVTGAISWNETYSTLYGRPAETSDSWRWWSERIHPEDRDRAVGGLRKAISSGASSWACDYRLLRADGGWAYINDRSCIARDGLGNAWRVVGAMQDWTDRKRAEDALRESDLQYREVFDNISACLFLVDVTADGRFKFAGFNPAEEQAVGLSNAEVSGKFVEDVFSEDLARKLTGNYRRCLEAGQAITYDDELNFPSGRRYFHSNLIPLQNRSGRINRIIGACIDITDLKRTQEEALAKQNLESLGVLASGIAHDFNNLLGGISALAELAEADMAANSSPGEQIGRIKAVASRGAEIVRELMIYAGQDRANLFEPVDLPRLVEEMLELLKVSVAKQVDLKIELDKTLPAVRGNAAQIRQVVMNLVINASEAIGSKEGVIHLSSSLVIREQGSAGNDALDLRTGDYVRLDVSDTGCGMTKEVSAKVFDPFFTTKFAGRGLGLAVVQGIVRAHGGAVDLVSAPGQGATFQVLLPCSSMTALKTLNGDTPSQAKQSNAGTGTILVVEDEEVLRPAVSKALRNSGYSVLDAGDGTAAIDLFLAHRDEIDAILLDVTIPGKSSREVFEEILRVRPNLKIVLTSAYSEETVASSFAGLRIMHFIRKPFKLAELTGVLRNVLSA
jgi:PAS domain S-box-containing protein